MADHVLTSSISVELAGDPRWTHAYFVEGPKSIPISYTLRRSGI